MTRDPQARSKREGRLRRTAPPREANDRQVTSVITIGWTIAFVVVLVLTASGSLPINQRWWAWTCATGVAMGLFGLWYVPILQRDRARAAAARLAEGQSPQPRAAGSPAAGPAAGNSAAGNSGAGGPAAGASGPVAQDSASDNDSLDNGSKTVSSTDTPGRSTRS